MVALDIASASGFLKTSRLGDSNSRVVRGLVFAFPIDAPKGLKFCSTSFPLVVTVFPNIPDVGVGVVGVGVASVGTGVGIHNDLSELRYEQMTLPASSAPLPNFVHMLLGMSDRFVAALSQAA